MAASSSREGLSKTGSGNSVKFAHPLHSRSILSALNENRRNPNLCDGVVIVEGKDIPVQRNVLAAASQYFRGLYSFDMPGTKPTLPSVTSLDHLTSASFEQILDYIYTAEIDLCDENIQDILQAADLLLMSDLKDLCCEYLEQCICTQNCLGIQEFTDKLSCPRVHQAAISFMDENFLEVSFTEEFKQLNMEQLKQVLQRSSLSTPKEDSILDCVLRWTQHDPENRKVFLQELLASCVKVNLVDEKYLQETILREDSIFDAQLRSAILEMKQEEQTEQIRARGMSSMLVIAGGEGPKDIVERFDDLSTVEIKRCVRAVTLHSFPQQKVMAWIDLAPMGTARMGHEIVELAGCMYAIGGKDNKGTILNSGEKYEPSTNTWTDIALMSHARMGFGLVAIDDKIYAVGGSNDMSDPLTSIEEYDIYNNKWRPLPDMNFKRAWSAVATCNKKIYVMAGGVMGKLYEAAECFDPKSETWTSVPPMKERRFDARAIGFGPEVFVFGGLRRLECPSALPNSGMKFCSTEVYLTDKKEWITMSRDTGMCVMTDMSHIDCVTQSGGEIFLMGDLYMGGYFNSVRAYKPATNSWRGVVQNHPSNQRGMPGCILRIPTATVYELMWMQNKLTYQEMKRYTRTGTVP